MEYIPENEVPRCPIHGSPMTLKPAGISKTSGKPYPAFWACNQKTIDGKYCNARPESGAPRKFAAAEFATNLANDAKNERIEKMFSSKQEDIRRSVALNDASEFVARTCSHYSALSNFDDAVGRTLELAEIYFDWLKKE